MARTRPGSRGAVFTLDMLTSVFFFFAIILGLLWLWGESQGRMNDFTKMSTIHKRLEEVSTMLVKTKGNPENWEQGSSVTSSNVNAIGLASQENVLDENKLRALQNADYEELRKIFGFSVENFSITVNENFDTVPNALYSKGQGQESKQRLVVRRYALLNDTRVEVKVEAYFN